MKNFKLTNLFFIALAIAVSSCSNDDNDDNDDNDGELESTTSNLTLNIEGLEDLGSDFLYEGWIIVDGEPFSTGTFSVNADNELSQSSFILDAEQLESATSFVLSIEPTPDPSTDPADTKIFIGDFDGDNAVLTTSTVAAYFDSISGKYVITAPTGNGTDEELYSGIWFLDNSSGTAVAGLDLPELEAGWKYEGWVVVDGVPLSTGTFSSVGESDDASPFSGDNAGPAYPGEDFLVNAPDGVTFPLDVRGSAVVVSVEPYPDNNDAPFTLKPLFGVSDEDAKGVQEISDYVIESYPTGSVSR